MANLPPEISRGFLRDSVMAQREPTLVLRNFSVQLLRVARARAEVFGLDFTLPTVEEIGAIELSSKDRPDDWKQPLLAR